MSNFVCEICGGCAYRNMSESAYRQYKEENFIKNIKRISAESIIDKSLFISDGQRRRAEMEFTFSKNKLTIGFNEEKSHNLIDINSCLMLTKELNQLLPQLHEFILEFCKIPLVIKNKKKITTQYINKGSVYMLAADNGIDIVLKLSMEPGLEHRLLVADFVNNTPNICRFSWNISGQQTETIVMQNLPEIYIAGCAIEVPQNAFLQASKAAETAMIEKVKEYLGETRGKIADLFCGLGTFTYPLAKLAGNEITSADSYEPALKGLQKALNRNQMQNVKIINRNLFKYPFDKDDLEGFRAIIMDPPRAGAHEQCREIAQIPNKDKPQKIIFISCNPNTFVYDATILVEAGYKMEIYQLKKMANAIRFLTADAINKSNSGHPGMPLGMADVATVLFAEYIKLNPEAPKWFDRDRFILSAGHGSMLLYSLLYLTGYKDINIDDIKNFRQFGSKTAGHPEYGHLDGIDMTTGPLGQGISSAVGMALAERMINARFGDKLCSHYTYVIAGDGCLMEGISEEAASLAGHLGLNKLIVFWDNNNITIDGTVDKASSTDQLARFKAIGWNTISINGHDYEEIRKAIETAQKSDKPTLVACKTTIGYGAPTKCGTSKCHGSPLGEEETAAMRKALDWNYEPFIVPDETLLAWQKTQERNKDTYQSWVQEATEAGKTFQDFITNKLPGNWDKELNAVKKKAIAEQTKVATRKASEMCLKAIVPAIPEIVGGSADLAASNLTFVEGLKTVTKGDYNGNNIMYGIREHAMGAIMNGLSLHGGAIPYGGTFFVFSDYMRPAQRLAALMGIRVIYVLTHDSIGVGEDGPTHQPVEHLAAYRAMPNILTFRPCDVVETAECWQTALTEKNRPSILALSRQGVPLIRAKAENNLSKKGAYIISPAKKERAATIIATGTEVHIAVAAQKILAEKGIDAAVVSMPCMELFEEQSLNYQLEVLGKKPVISVEAASTFGWNRYAQKTIGIDSFGASAPAGKLYEYYGLTAENIAKEVESFIRKS